MPSNQERDLAAERLDAQLRAAVARVRELRSAAEERRAQDEMSEISGLDAFSEKARQRLAELKQNLSENFTETKRATEKAIDDLEVRIERVSERYAAWDAARERRFNARIDQAEAKLRQWKAQAQAWEAERGMKRHDELAKLEENIERARARAADVRRDWHNRKAQEALHEAARHLDAAFEAAATRYDRE